MVLLKRFLPLYTSIRNHQVTVLGGASDIGQTICLLLRPERKITKLVIHDTLPQTLGVTLDLFHVPTNTIIKGYVGEDTLRKSLEKSEIVIASGGLIRKPGITDTLWSATNANFIRTFAKELSKIKPMPFVGIVTEPINTLVPIAAEIMKKHGQFDPKKLFGINTLNEIRAQTLYAADHNLSPCTVSVPVIGGHSNETSIPLLSQAKPSSRVDHLKAQIFTSKYRKIEENLMKAKTGISPVVSVAYSTLLFVRSILQALDGETATVNAFVENNDFGTQYFGGRVNIDYDGIKEMQTYTKLSNFECELLETSIGQLRQDILKGKNILECA